MKNLLVMFLSCLVFLGCNKNKGKTLESYIDENSSLERAELIACAAGTPDGFNGDSQCPTSVFFYPIEGATDIRYFEAEKLKDSLKFKKYFEKDLSQSLVFNGYLRKFNNSEFKKERMGIVTYKTNGKLHVCDPIRLKTNEKPTETNSALITVTENGVTPLFEWTDGIIDENVIYFQVISDMDGNLISGTYTYEKHFEFYNLDNVVLNVSPTNTTPTLAPNQDYRFTLMAVSEDNWVNLFGEKVFSTN